MGKNKSINLQIKFWITLFVGITFSYGIWLIWKKLTDWIGDSWMILGIIGAILIIAMLTGFFSFKKVAERFT